MIRPIYFTLKFWNPIQSLFISCTWNKVCPRCVEIRFDNNSNESKEFFGGGKISGWSMHNYLWWFELSKFEYSNKLSKLYSPVAVSKFENKTVWKKQTLWQQFKLYDFLLWNYHFQNKLKLSKNTCLNNS